MTFQEWQIELGAKQQAVQKATHELHLFVQETVGVNLAAPIGIEAVAQLASKVFEIKAQEQK